MLGAVIQARLLSKRALRDSYEIGVAWVPSYLRREIAILEQAEELYSIGRKHEARTLLRKIT